MSLSTKQIYKNQVKLTHMPWFTNFVGVVEWCEGAMYLPSLGCPTDVDLQLGKACYPCSR